MSGLITGLVLQRVLTQEYTGPMKFCAVVYADHAWQDGTHAYPSIATVAKETGFSERTVQRYVRKLETIGMLIPDGKGPKGTTNYRFPLEQTPEGGWLLRLGLGGDTVTPQGRHSDTPSNPRGDTDSGDTSVTLLNRIGGGGGGGDSHPGAGGGSGGRMTEPTQTYDHRITIVGIPAGSGGSGRPELSEALQERLTQAGVYRSIWPDVRNRLAIGWSEDDVLAVIAWSGGGARFTARIREGSKAPDYYYSTLAEGAQADPDPEMDPETAAIVDGLVAQDETKAWQDQQQAPEQIDWWARFLDGIEMRREWRDTLLRADPTWAGSTLVLTVPGDQAELLADRLSKTLARGLTGLVAGPDGVAVEFRGRQ